MDDNYLFNPEIDAFSIFGDKQDIDGNMGTTFKVNYLNKYYVLEKSSSLYLR